MSGAQLTQAAMRLVGVEGGGGLEGVLGVDEIDLGGLDAAVEQRVEHEVLLGEFWARTIFLPFRSADRA